MPDANHVQAQRVGAKARELLNAPRASGQILAVVSSTVYLSVNGGEVLWIAREGLSLHRRGLSASIPFSALEAGMPLSMQGQQLRLGDRLTVDLGETETWSPASVGPGEAAPRSILDDHFRQILSAAGSLSETDGVIQSLPMIAALARGEAVQLPHASDPFIARALGPIEQVARAVLRRDMAGAAQEGEALIGLGPGLTPSGDDFLGGLFFTAHALKAAYPDAFHWDDQPITALVDQAHTQTNAISHAFLSDMAAGHGLEPLHGLVAGLLSGQTLDSVTPHTQRLAKIGHSSGRDMLAGALTGLLMISENA